MQDINIDQGELETLIAIVSPKFGSKETAIFTDLKGDIVIKNRGESITGWYPILTLEFLLLAWAGMPKTSFRKNSDSPHYPLFN
jgi:hypothetical protein